MKIQFHLILAIFLTAFTPQILKAEKGTITIDNNCDQNVSGNFTVFSNYDTSKPIKEIDGCGTLIFRLMARYTTP